MSAKWSLKTGLISISFITSKDQHFAPRAVYYLYVLLCKQWLKACVHFPKEELNIFLTDGNKPVTHPDRLSAPQSP